MTICPHCSCESNNLRYCMGCGRKFKEEKQRKSAVHSSDSPKFVEDVISIIEERFATSVAPEFSVVPTAISLEEISKEDGIMLIGSEQLAEVSAETRNNCFFGEILLIYILSGITTMIGYIAGADESEMVLQLYASSFLTISFIILFAVPYFSGLSLISSAFFRCSMFLPPHEPVKNKMHNLLTFFLFSSVPYIFVVPFIWSLIAAKRSKNYNPAALKMSEICYLERVKDSK